MAKAQTTHQEPEFPKVPDFAQLYADFNRMFADYGKFFANGKAPMFDFEAAFVSQRKNVEALTAANQLVFEGVQAVARRQAEIVRKSFEELSQVSRELATVGRPEDKLVKQATLAKEAFESATANAREIADMLQKSSAKAIDVLNSRVSENLDEVKAALSKANKH
jgi:phasin family protein